MGEPRGDAQATRAAILAAARHLFAERDIASVSIRDIARSAGVSHGLVQRYFGTREQMVQAIIRSEVDMFIGQAPPLPGGVSDDDLQLLRGQLRAGLEHFRDYARLIARAELAGIEPEKMLEPNTATPAAQLAGAISAMQPEGSADLDPRMVSAYVNACLFAFATMGPWLMASVGYGPHEYEARLDDVVDISVALVALAVRGGAA